mmetsp:Transcript_62282/g.176903  ORF Transcript_62282/g.176903 Transcript_62282/m.176903 type:complete len:225 (+) Transcript_62282:2478-3152(+)
MTSVISRRPSAVSSITSHQKGACRNRTKMWCSPLFRWCMLNARCSSKASGMRIMLSSFSKNASLHLTSTLVSRSREIFPTAQPLSRGSPEVGKPAAPAASVKLTSTLISCVLGWPKAQTVFPPGPCSDGKRRSFSCIVLVGWAWPCAASASMASACCILWRSLLYVCVRASNSASIVDSASRSTFFTSAKAAIGSLAGSDEGIGPRAAQTGGTREIMSGAGMGG